jgi:hypothetical protein
VPSRPDAHLSTVPSVWMMCHTVRTPDIPSIIRQDDMYFRPDPSLHRETSIPACIRLDVSVARPDASQYSTKLQILSMFSYGKIDATFRTTWIPVRTHSYIRQESQFKYNHPDERASDMEIADLASTIRTLAFHGPDARTTDMEIAC